MDKIIRYAAKHERGILASWLSLSLVPLLVAAHNSQHSGLFLFSGMTIVSFAFVGWRLWGWITLERQWQCEHEKRLQGIFTSIEDEWAAPVTRWESVTEIWYIETGPKKEVHDEPFPITAENLDD